MGGLRYALQLNPAIWLVASLCHLCPVGAQVGAAGRRKVAKNGLWSQFRAFLSFSVVRSPHLRGRRHECQAVPTRQPSS